MHHGYFTSCATNIEHHTRSTDGADVIQTCDVTITTGTTLTVSNNRILMWFPIGTLYANTTGNYIYIKRILGRK